MTTIDHNTLHPVQFQVIHLLLLNCIFHKKWSHPRDWIPQEKVIPDNQGKNQLNKRFKAWTSLPCLAEHTSQILSTPWHIQGLQTDNGMYLYGATTAMGAESRALSEKETPNPLVTSLQPVPETDCLLASSTIRCYPLSNLARPLHLCFHFHLSYPCFLVSHIKYRRHKKEWITYMRLRLIALSPCYMWISSLRLTLWGCQTDSFWIL